MDAAVQSATHTGLTESARVENDALSILVMNRPDISTCTGIAENDSFILGYTGHVVTNDLPLRPDAGSLLGVILPNVEDTIASLDGLYVVAVYDKKDNRLVLGTDRYGFTPLYLLNTGNGLVFSTSMDLVIRSSPVDLNIDMVAVSQFVQIQYCLGDRTFVSEIQRMSQGDVLVYDVRSRSARFSRYFDYTSIPEPDSEATDAVVSNLASEIENAVRGRVQKHLPHLCLLSGGRDSRSIAGALVNIGGGFSTLTTDSDNGVLDDMDLAAVVAKTLGVPNSFLALPADYVERLWRDKCRVSDFSTAMHTWIMHMGTSGNYDGAVAFDGLIGDVMLKPHMLDADHLDLLGRKKLRILASELALFMLAGRRMSELLKERVAKHWGEQLANTVRNEIVAFDGHPNTVSFFWLQHRSRRAIASSPCSILSQRWLMVAPFSDPRVFAIAMSIPPRAKLGGNINNRIVSAINAELGAIPFSSDRVWPSSFTRRQRTRLSIATPGALASYLEVIEEEAGTISSFLHPQWLSSARKALEAGPMERWHYLRDAGVTAELCYWLQIYRYKVNIDALSNPC